MKRTYWKAELNEYSEYGGFVANEKITCEVYGEMDDGTKVWQDVNDGKFYFCFRMLGVYYFVAM